MNNVVSIRPVAATHTPGTYHCPKCERDAFPTFVPDKNFKLQVQCSNSDCNYQDSTLGPLDFSKAVSRDASGVDHVVEPSANITDKHPERRRVRATNAPVALAPAVVAPTYPAATSLLATTATPPSGNIFDVLEARVASLIAEEGVNAAEMIRLKARNATVIAERKQLEKMLRSSGKRFLPSAAMMAALTTGEQH